jgi:hypothetical protein
MLRIRSRRTGLVGVAAVAVLLSFPVPALADVLPHDGSVVLQVNADVTIPAGVHRDAVIVIAGDVAIQGEVDTVVVIDGTATLTGARVETLVVAGGTADVAAGSTVDQVRILDSVYHASPEATVGSYETIEPAVFAAAIAPLALAVWFGFAIAYLLAGLVLAAIAGSQLRRAGASLTREPVTVVMAAIGVLVGLPLLVALLAVTVVGIPAALAVAMVAIPLVWFVGSVSMAVRIGDWVLLRLRDRIEESHPVVAAFIGLVAVGVLSVIPVLGFLLGLAGAGAALLVGWRAAFGRRLTGAASTVQPGPMAA